MGRFKQQSYRNLDSELVWWFRKEADEQNIRVGHLINKAMKDFKDNLYFERYGSHPNPQRQCTCKRAANGHVVSIEGCQLHSG